jgi:DNA-binding response OmpR family regulator
MKVLLIEEDKGLLDRTARLLRKEGVHVAVAQSKKDFFKKVAEGKKFDVVVLDIFMLMKYLSSTKSWVASFKKNLK